MDGARSWRASPWHRQAGHRTILRRQRHLKRRAYNNLSARSTAIAVGVRGEDVHPPRGSRGREYIPVTRALVSSSSDTSQMPLRALSLATNYQGSIQVRLVLSFGGKDIYRLCAISDAGVMVVDLPAREPHLRVGF